MASSNLRIEEVSGWLDLHAGIELHDEDAVLVFAENMVEEAQAGAALLVEHLAWLPLVSTIRPSVRGRSVSRSEIADGLRPAVLGQ